MIFELTGRVYYIGEKIPYGSSEKLDIGITIMENCPYPNLMFEAWGEAATKVAALNPGIIARVKFELQGKTYQGKDGVMRSYTIMKISEIEAIAERSTTTKQEPLTID